MDQDPLGISRMLTVLQVLLQTPALMGNGKNVMFIVLTGGAI